MSYDPRKESEKEQREIRALMKAGRRGDALYRLGANRVSGHISYRDLDRLEDEINGKTSESAFERAKR